MSATLYDEALMKKINSWTEKSKLQVFGPSEARTRLAVLADINDDKSIKLPFLVLSRPDGYTINNHNKRPISYNGKRFDTTDGTDQDKMLILNAIPITLTYQLDVYTRYEQEADAYMRELIFNFVNYPSVKVLLPYLNCGIVHESTVRFSSDDVQVDRGSLSIRTDQVFNYGIQLAIDDAYMWDLRQKDPVSIGTDLHVVSFNNPDLSTSFELIKGGKQRTKDLGETEY